jgi:hypothetical protein
MLTNVRWPELGRGLGESERRLQGDHVSEKMAMKRIKKVTALTHLLIVPKPPNPI